ncbi:MAG: hypothetical protein WC501_02065 [Candidatus Micrarchaeia archaeon]
MIEDILEEMKNEGYRSAVIQKDGTLFKSNFQFEEPTPSIVASMLNVSDALLKQAEGNGKEYELALEDGSILVGIPINDYYLVSILEDREKKKIIREYASKMKDELK